MVAGAQQRRGAGHRLHHQACGGVGVHPARPGGVDLGLGDEREVGRGAAHQRHRHLQLVLGHLDHDADPLEQRDDLRP